MDFKKTFYLESKKYFTITTDGVEITERLMYELKRYSSFSISNMSFGVRIFSLMKKKYRKKVALVGDKLLFVFHLYESSLLYLYSTEFVCICIY